MIVANGTAGPNNDRVLLLGLSDENVRRLTDGQPIKVSRETHGEGIPDGLIIVLIHGKDEAALARQFIPTECVLIEDPKLGKPENGT
jgi:hypothetical protein